MKTKVVKKKVVKERMIKTKNGSLISFKSYNGLLSATYKLAVEVGDKKAISKYRKMLKDLK